MIPPIAIEYGGRSWTLVADGGRWRIGELPRAGWRVAPNAAERYLKRMVDSGEALALLEEADEATTRAVACDRCRDAPPTMRAPAGRGLWCAACVEKYNDGAGMRQEDPMDRSEEIRARFVGITVCQPLAWWSSMDVGALMFSRDVPLFPVYQCCAMHGDPGLVRLDGVLPGEFGSDGGTIWLRRYWPSVFERLGRLFPALRGEA